MYDPEHNVLIKEASHDVFVKDGRSFFYPVDRSFNGENVSYSASGEKVKRGHKKNTALIYKTAGE